MERAHTPGRGDGSSDVQDEYGNPVDEWDMYLGSVWAVSGQNTANPAAEGSIRADESRLVKQVERMGRSIGAALGWSLGVAERIRRHSWESDGKISILWHDPGTPTEAQRADALSKKTGGKPVLSVRGALLELGFTQARIDKELEWLAQERDGYFDVTDAKLERDSK